MNWRQMVTFGALVMAGCAAEDQADSPGEASGTAADSPFVGSATTPADAQGTVAVAELRDSSGAVVGEATLVEGAGGSVEVALTVAGLEAGEHGVHVHETGRCEPPFESAGGHFNPDSTQHGLENPEGPHAGDLPNVSVDDAGNGSLTETTDLFTLGFGDRSLFDEDGAAIVVHAEADDMTSDPAGDAGGRVACGVLERR